MHFKEYVGAIVTQRLKCVIKICGPADIYVQSDHFIGKASIYDWPMGHEVWVKSHGLRMCIIVQYCAYYAQPNVWIPG